MEHNEGSCDPPSFKPLAASFARQSSSSTASASSSAMAAAASYNNNHPAHDRSLFASSALEMAMTEPQTPPTPPLVRLFRAAHHTLHGGDGHGVVTPSEDGLERVRALASQLTLDDLAVSLPLFRPSSPRVPILYAGVYDSAALSIGIFFLRAGTLLSCHDHPGMHVVSKVLAGTLRMQSYDMAAPFELELVGDEMLDAASPACVLRPGHRNIHSIVAVTDCCLLDIMNPPYSDERECTYYHLAPVNDSRSARRRLTLSNDGSQGHDHADIDAVAYTGIDLTLLDPSPP